MDLGYKQAMLKQLFGKEYLNIDLPFIENLPYALVLQPISAGFTGLAAGAALLAVCTNSLLFVLAAFWAGILSIATLVVELVLFINGRDKLNQELNAASYGEAHADLGPALWLQVAATAAVLVGFFFLAAAWSMNRPAAQPRPYEAPLPLYGKHDDPYGYDQPVQGPRYNDFPASDTYPDPVPAPAPAPALAPYLAPAPAAASAPVMSTGAGRAFDSGRPYDAGPPADHGAHLPLTYDPNNAGSFPARHTSRRSSRRDNKRRHSSRSSLSRRHSGRSGQEPSMRRSADYDYAYNVPSRSISRQNMARERRRSHDPYLDRADQYEMDMVPRRSSRFYPGDDYYDDARQVPSQRWKRYGERGAF